MSIYNTNPGVATALYLHLPRWLRTSRFYSRASLLHKQSDAWMQDTISDYIEQKLFAAAQVEPMLLQKDLWTESAGRFILWNKEACAARSYLFKSVMNFSTDNWRKLQNRQRIISENQTTLKENTMIDNTQEQIAHNDLLKALIQSCNEDEMTIISFKLKLLTAEETQKKLGCGRSSLFIKSGNLIKKLRAQLGGAE